MATKNKSQSWSESDITDHYPSYKDWTVKQRLFFRYLIKTQSPTSAAMKAYDCKDRLVARNIGSSLLAKLGISMRELLDIIGLDSEQDAKDLKRLRSAKSIKHFAHEGRVITSKVDQDNSTQLRALDLTQRIKGNIRETAPSPVFIDNSTHTHHTHIELKNKTPQELTDIVLGRTAGGIKKASNGPSSKRKGLSR